MVKHEEETKAVALLESLKADTINLTTFIEQYTALWLAWREGGLSFSEPVQEALDNLFVACDCFVPDPSERDEIDIDEQEIIDEADSALQQLQKKEGST